MGARAGAAPGTIVVATRDRAHRLPATLDHLGEEGDGWPVVVVDDGSVDDTAAVVCRYAEDRPPGAVRLVRLDASRGAAARNAGARASGTDLVAFADDDSWWAEGSLDAAACLFQQHPDLGLVCATVLVGEAGVVDPVVAAQRAAPLGRTEVGPRVLGFLACSAVVRTHAFLDVGGFDELLGVGGEEEALAIDLRSRGWDLVLAEDLVVHHHPEPRSDRRRRSRDARCAANRVLVDWMRRPVRRAVGGTSALAVRALRDPDARRALWEVRAGLPRALGRRSQVPDWLEAELRAVEARPGGRSTSGWSGGEGPTKPTPEEGP